MILIYYYFPSFYFKAHIKIDVSTNNLWPLYTLLINSIDFIRFDE